MSIRRTIIHGKGFHVFDESLGNNSVIVEGEIPFDNLMEVIVALTEWADRYAYTFIHLFH